MQLHVLSMLFLSVITLLPLATKAEADLTSLVSCCYLRAPRSPLVMTDSSFRLSSLPLSRLFSSSANSPSISGNPSEETILVCLSTSLVDDSYTSKQHRHLILLRSSVELQRRRSSFTLFLRLNRVVNPSGLTHDKSLIFHLMDLGPINIKCSQSSPCISNQESFSGEVMSGFVLVFIALALQCLSMCERISSFSEVIICSNGNSSFSSFYERHFTINSSYTERSFASSSRCCWLSCFSSSSIPLTTQFRLDPRFMLSTWFRYFYLVWQGSFYLDLFSGTRLLGIRSQPTCCLPFQGAEDSLSLVRVRFLKTRRNLCIPVWQIVILRPMIRSWSASCHFMWPISLVDLTIYLVLISLYRSLSIYRSFCYLYPSCLQTCYLFCFNLILVLCICVSNTLWLSFLLYKLVGCIMLLLEWSTKNVVT
ncbi:PREDICTED: uncharacterized protein LOC104726890 [Camelina sativa]|uniref:Uncharacterized protein LOC104726890 n=1 Tax=Camelina sativa TaxID=90675 RepID=A0ABM1QNN1_CAMSA|nr:PREDICTED: uncharacterized protein LOC104726890 [Camelina sativa]